MKIHRYLEIAQCPVCKNNNLHLTDSSELSCPDCESKFMVKDDVPRMIPNMESSDSIEKLRSESYRYWDGGIPGTVKNGYQEGKVCCDYGTEEWFITGDKVRYDQYKNIPRFCDFKAFSGKKVLDIGPGRGQETYNYSKAGSFVTTLEYAGQGVNIVRDRINTFALDVDLIQGDAVSIPMANNSFDLVFSYGVLHHIPEMEKSIEEVFRVLKPGGLAKIMVYHKGYAYYKDILLKWYLLKGNFLKYSWGDYIKIAMEQRTGPCPVVYIHNMNEIFKLFNSFEMIDYFNAEVVGGRLIRWKVLPSFLQKRWMNYLGAYCHLTLRKPY